jgi:hypothetical protein
MTRFLAFLAVLLLATPAAAADRLAPLLAEGEQFVRKGDAGCAAPLERAILAADDVQHTGDDYARAIGSLGLCREVQGRYGEAHRLVSRALEAAPAEMTAAGKAAPWKPLREAQRRLDDRVARALVTWPDGAELYVDGLAVAAVSGVVLAVDPGRRLFEARRDGKTLAASTVEVRAGDLPKVALVTPIPTEKTSPIGTVEGAKTAPLATPSPFAPALSLRGVAVTIGYAGLATALVSGAVAGVLEAQRMSLRSGLASDACPTPDASVRCAQLRQVFDQSRGARDVALIAGGIGLAAGAVGIGVYFGVEQRAPVVGATWSGSW